MYDKHSHFKQLESVRGKRTGCNQIVDMPTNQDGQNQLTREGYYAKFAAAGKMEMPGCSLCMGNQARVKDGVTVLDVNS